MIRIRSRLLTVSKQQKIIIGGITGGIGAALARRLVAEGHAVAGFARDSQKLDQLSVELHDMPTASVDATDASSLNEAIGSLTDELGGVDAYVHAIGSIFLKPAHLTKDEEWQAILELNLSSAFYALRSVVRFMQKQTSGGSCLFFSTAAANVGIANHECIAAAKGGVEALVRSAAATYSSRGIRVNAIAPSLTDTPLSQPIIGSERGLEISKKMHPLGLIGEAEDVASLAEWMLSDAAKFVTGQIYVMDGGLSSILPKPKV